MKKRYDNYGKIIFMFFVFLIIFFIVTILLMNRKIVLYKVFSSVVYNEDVLVLLLDNDDVKIFNKNKKIYIENKSKTFEIMKIDKDVLERKGKKYNQVYIKVNISNMYKVGDVVDISVAEKSVASLKIFSIIWEGD